MKSIIATSFAAGMMLAAFAQSVSTVGVSMNPTNFTVKGSSTNFHLANADRGVATVDTIAQLAATTNGQHGAVVFVRGRWAANDWDEPKAFILRTNSVASTNDIILANAGGSGRWIHPWDGALMAFGVKADGATDDTTATQSAINYAVANGLTLYLPTGYHTSIVSGLTVSDDSNIKGPDDMFAMSSSIVAGEQNRWIWKLKDGADTWVLKYTAGQHTLSGITIDGNRDNNSADVPALYIDVGFTSYKESHWENIGVFNSSGDGIYNRAHSPVFDRVMSQNNDGNGLVIYNGYDCAITHSYFGGNGKHGILALDHGSFRFVQVDSFQNEMSGIKLLNPFLGYFDKIVCNNNLQNGMLLVTAPSTNFTTGSAVTNAGLLGQFSVMNSQLINNNYPTKKDGTPSSEASGSWSNLKMEGSGSVHPFNIINTQFYLTESSRSSKPKYLVESTASGFPNFYGGNFINCRYTTNASFFVDGAFSGTILTTAGFTQLREATSSADYSYWPFGNLTLGGSGYTGRPFTISQTGSEMIEMNRTGLPQKWKLYLGFRSVILSEETANFKGFTFENNGTPILWFGTTGSGGNNPVSGSIKAESATSGVNTKGANLNLHAGSGTGGSFENGSINFYTPQVWLTNSAGSWIGASHSTSQVQTLRLQILNDGTLFLPMIQQPTSIAGGQFYYGTNSESPGVTNWWFARPNTTSNKWVALP